MIDYGIGVIVAHPDDFELIAGEKTVRWLRGRGVNRIDVWHPTRGEYGKLFGVAAAPDVVAGTRRKELARAARAGGYRGLFFPEPFEDGSLGRHQEELNDAVTNVVRRHKYGALFSFSRTEGPLTPVFAHRDHLAVAIATEIASEVADNAHEYPRKGVLPLGYRPEVYGWEAIRRLGAWDQYAQVPMTFRDVLDQVAFMAKHHASQFTDPNFLQELLLRLYKGEKRGTYRKLYNRLR